MYGMDIEKEKESYHFRGITWFRLRSMIERKNNDIRTLAPLFLTATPSTLIAYKVLKQALALLDRTLRSLSGTGTMEFSRLPSQAG
jgi:hypothetical protein